MKMIFLGPPGSGKETQAILLSRKYNIKKISIKEILKNTIFDVEKFGEHKIDDVDFADTMKDPIIALLIEKIMQRHNCFENFILNSFPKTILQAEEMEKRNILINYIIEFKTSKQVIYERILKKKNYNNIKNTYKKDFHANNVIENHNISFQQEKEIQKIREKLLDYKNIRNTILKFYQKKIKNQTIQHHIINSDHDIDLVFKKITKIFKNNKKIKNS